MAGVMSTEENRKNQGELDSIQHGNPLCERIRPFVGYFGHHSISAEIAELQKYLVQ
jgi:hypothetical protein